MPKSAPYQPQLLDPQAAKPQPINPRNGTHFRLPELYAALDCQTVDVVRLTPDLILIIDDESKFREPCYLNLLATYLWYQHVPEARGLDAIVGRVILCHDNQFR